MLYLSWPLLQRNLLKEFHIIIPSEKPEYAEKLNLFFSSFNNIFPGYVPLKRECFIDESLLVNVSGQPVIIYSFPNAPQVLPEAALNFITTF
jgi:hypothetical protein